MLKIRGLFKIYKKYYIQQKKFSVKAERKKKDEKAAYNGIFPAKFLNKKHKTPDHLYLAEPEGANLIDKLLDPYLKKTKCDTILEINPGAGFLTDKLIKRRKFNKVILVENLEHFRPQLQLLQEKHPERIKTKFGDFISLWKLVFQDKVDNGKRVAELLEDVPKREFDDDLNMVMFGTVGSYVFFKHLINSVIFQNSLFNVGRCEMFLIMPPPIFIHLTCLSDVGYMIYRSTSILFQMLFEYRFIGKVPRECFLPKQTDYNLTKFNKLGRIKSINPDYFYLARIVPRRNIFDLCPAEDLPALWYFVKQNTISRRNRIIPNLEKWIPGCGPRLIINTHKTETIKLLYKDEKPEDLPKFSKQSTTMSCHNYYPNINIYTEFGELNASQILTIFRQFRNWPEYNESSFLASLENSFIKMEASADDSIDAIDINEEDDISSENINLAETITNEETTTKGTKTPNSRSRRKIDNTT